MRNRYALPLWALALLAAFTLPLTAQAQQQPGGANANVETEQVQDWEVRCPQDPSGQASCTMAQMVNNPDSNQPLMRVAMAYPQELDTAAMVFMLPLGTRLAPGLQLSVDGGEPIQFPYQVCFEQGCRADLPVRPELLQQLRSGSAATLSIIGPQGNRLDLDISLMGFTEASQRIER